MDTISTTGEDIRQRIREVEAQHRRDIDTINDFCSEIAEEYSMEAAWNDFVKMVNPQLRYHLQPLSHTWVVTKELTVTIRGTVQAASEEHAEELAADLDYELQCYGDFEHVDDYCDSTTVERD